MHFLPAYRTGYKNPPSYQEPPANHAKSVAGRNIYMAKTMINTCYFLLQSILPRSVLKLLKDCSWKKQKRLAGML